MDSPRGKIYFSDHALEDAIKHLSRKNQNTSSNLTLSKIKVILIGENAVNKMGMFSQKTVNASTIEKCDTVHEIQQFLQEDIKNSIFIIDDDNLGLVREALEQFLNSIDAVIFCRKDKRIASKPLFLVSIPKAGTHLLTSIVQELGFKPGNASAGYQENFWYPLVNTNTHTTTEYFFVDYVNSAPHGGRLHPFPYSPTIFIYRNPLDILISEANYYPQKGKTLFAAYFDGLSKQDIIRELIHGDLLGPFHKRIHAFKCWLRFKNVVSISFEELVSEHRGGKQYSQSKTIWSLMIKLNRSGSLEEIINHVNGATEKSDTFFDGIPGKFRFEITREDYDYLFNKSPDLLDAFGYQKYKKNSYDEFTKQNWEHYGIGDFVEERRYQRLLLDEQHNFITPVLIDEIEGYNIVIFQNKFIGLRQGMEVNFQGANPNDFEFVENTKEKLIIKILYSNQGYIN